VGFVDAYEIPGDVLARFRSAHTEVDDDATLRVVSAAARQWFRLLAAAPAARLGLPSRAVADLWLESTRDGESYARFCSSAFGRVLPATPLTVPVGGCLPDGPDLVRTLRAARADEPAAPSGLPQLFRVDETVGIAGGRRYVASCGGGAECHRVPGRWCLTHLAGESGRPPPHRRHRPGERATNEIPNSQARTFPSG
jgi:hypothetical protein